MSAATERSARATSVMTMLACAVMLAWPNPTAAQRLTPGVIAGAAIAFGVHELSHVAMDEVFDASPGLKKVSFGPIPFFAITHPPVSSAREFAISSAGFWAQHATDEWLLSRRPRLRDADATLLKGMFTFNVLASVAYAGAAVTAAGPGERDTRGMAVSADMPEPVIAGVILAPAVLDVWRYYRPDARWPKWASRVVKVGGVLLVIKAARS